MFGPWCCGPGWIAGLIGGIFWILIIVLAVVFLKRELPRLERHHHRSSPALRLLEERYARGEITREEFLHRREVLAGRPAAPGRPPGGGGGAPPAYSPRDTHVRVSSAAPPSQPRPGAPEQQGGPPAPPPPRPAGPGPTPDPGPGNVRPGPQSPADPTEPLPPIAPPGS
jgi:Short C-terminal domain